MGEDGCQVGKRILASGQGNFRLHSASMKKGSANRPFPRIFSPRRTRPTYEADIRHRCYFGQQLTCDNLFTFDLTKKDRVARHGPVDREEVMREAIETATSA
ncbi:hypothetical protein BCF46_2717 [Litoreibacter meonggei]|uniref:Uncharacterized protein n=1 Tax=Litoreibacter meonggei TaxID=1049199 RepID=A0A497VUN3_9RHOB|nr:hypothetical protein BCF46_2717 [Litoreibacter meonggei]